MQIKGAMTVLKKQMEFLGMSFEELIAFIERAPLAHNDTTRQAFEVFTTEMRRGLRS
jgi:hypothetical protein